MSHIRWNFASCDDPERREIAGFGDVKRGREGLPSADERAPLKKKKKIEEGGGGQ